MMHSFVSARLTVLWPPGGSESQDKAGGTEFTCIASGIEKIEVKKKLSGGGPEEMVGSAISGTCQLILELLSKKNDAFVKNRAGYGPLAFWGDMPGPFS
ncbi:hypothetical protein [Sphingobacterium sp. BS-2]|uniref:hypothetical protein n=1 Tax=Sphingobacterium sp. BS-2 TaxID=3377129 RepID=UPI0038FD12E0